MNIIFNEDSTKKVQFSTCNNPYLEHYFGCYEQSIDWIGELMIDLVILYLYNLFDNHYSDIESIHHEIQYFEISIIHNTLKYIIVN